MFLNSSSVEALRWGTVAIPGVLFNYAKELDLDMEDIGIIATILYAFERSKPLYQTGIKVGQVLLACSSLSKQKLSRRLNRLNKMGIIKLSDTKPFTQADIYIEPLFAKIESLVIRDHSLLSDCKEKSLSQEEYNSLIESYENRIKELELKLEQANNQADNESIELVTIGDRKYIKVADFIAKKTGNLMSVKMANELKKWLDEFAFAPEFLLIMLELCFERKIYNPKDITIIARDLKEYSINTVEGLEMYFKKYVDNEKQSALRARQFDPDIIEFGNFTGIDMTAEARRKVYYKWRYDWGFSHNMIMKAGEIMCQRTKNGGLEYIDSVLNDWLSKEIRQVEEAEKEVKEFSNRKKKDYHKNTAPANKAKNDINDYEIYVPPTSLEYKSNVK